MLSKFFVQAIADTIMRTTMFSQEIVLYSYDILVHCRSCARVVTFHAVLLAEMFSSLPFPHNHCEHNLIILPNPCFPRTAIVPTPVGCSALPCWKSKTN